MPAGPSETDFLNRTELSLLTNGRLRWAMEIGRFCRGNLQTGPWNLGKFSTEYCVPYSSVV